MRGVKEKRLMSKSAQKYRSANQANVDKEGECAACVRLRDESIFLRSEV